MSEDRVGRDLRISSAIRGVLIAVLVGGYAWVVRAPAASYTLAFLAAAGLQVVVIALRRFVPPDRLPQTIYVFELLADGVSVLLFALGIFGGILRVPEDF